MVDGAAVAIEKAAQIIEGAGKVQSGHVDVPMRMGGWRTIRSRKPGCTQTPLKAPQVFFFVNQIFHNLGDHLVFLLQPGLKFRSAALLSLRRSPVCLLESVFSKAAAPFSKNSFCQRVNPPVA